MDFIYSRNDALEVNPQGGQSHLSEGGSDWLFAVMACFTLAFLAYYVLSFRPRHGEKIFHYLFTIALLVGAISYFAMASGLAYSVIPTHLTIRSRIAKIFGIATGALSVTALFNNYIDTFKYI